MHPDIKLLVDLQAVDLRLFQLRAQLAALPQQLAGVDQQVSQARQRVTAAKDSLAASLKARKTFEMDVESWKDRARKYRDQSAAVKTNEAYKALQHEIQHAEQEMAHAEDRLLERMVAGEQFERDVKAAELELADVERIAAAERQKLAAQQTALQQELDAKHEERRKDAAAIPPELLQVYEYTAHRAHHHDIGIAEVRNEACSQCGARVLPHIIQKLRRETGEVYQCEACSRVLYYVEPPPAPAPSPDAKSNAAGSSEE
jgi:predicted  nucleic acid-binding Zn-ribbon protein